MSLWDNYFVATAGASAALTGLIFVGVSLNLKTILSVAHLPDRALGSLMLLVNIMLASTFCLVPGQPSWCLGGEILGLGLLVWIIAIRLDMRAYGRLDPQYSFHFYQNLIFMQLAVLPFLFAGVWFMIGGKGYYWLIPGITISFVKGLLDSWVLLVEINR